MLERSQITPKMKILKVLPALTVLKDNVKYRIARGNEYRTFSMHARKGISSLQFRRKPRKSKTFNLDIVGRPKIKKEKIAGKIVNLEKVNIHLIISVL